MTIQSICRATCRHLSMLGLLLCIVAPQALADETPSGPQQVKYQVTGLFQPDREQDLRDLFETMPRFKVVSIDYAHAEVVLEYDGAKIWPGQKQEKYLELLNNQVRTASRSTFGVKPLCAIPLEKLQEIEIPVAGLDCKGCSYAAYEMVARLPGVERATASFKDGKVKALIDPEQTDRAQLEAALKKGGVDIPAPVVTSSDK